MGRRLWTGVLGASLLGLAGAASAHAQNPVPDAPKPQTLPDLNAITPVAPAVHTGPQQPGQNGVPNSPTPNDSAASEAQAIKENGGKAPTSELPTVNGEKVKENEQLTVDEAQPGSAPDAGIGTIRVQVNYVEIPFTVKDSKNRDVPGITWREVRIYENNQRIPHIARYVESDAAPLSVALVIDQSVTQDTMDKVNTALGALQGAFTQYDEMAVFTYNNGVRKRDGYSVATGARLGVVLDQAKSSGNEPLMGMDGPLSQTTVKNNQQVDPNTSPIRNQNGLTFNVPREFHTLNDAIFEAAQSLSHADRGRRRVVYVISDGKEYGSKAKQKEVIRYLQTNKIAVYATLVGDSSIPGLGFLDRIHIPLQMRDDVLPRYTAATGGQFDPEFGVRGIEKSFMDLATTVRTQYVVGYYSHESLLDDKFRKVEVRVLRPGLTIVAKDGYYPNPQDGARPAPRATAQVPASAPVAAPSPTAAQQQ